MKVALCCIERLENKYIREFVDYYYNLGIDHIFMYDTNNDNEDNIEDVINDYITSGFVEKIKWNIHKPRTEVLMAYQDCYDKRLQEYDWCCFFDPDEYLELYKDNNIKDYLSRSIFDNFDIIAVNWLNMDDNDLLYYENKPQMKRFTRPCFNQYEFQENKKFKCILRTNCDNINWLNGRAHCPDHSPQKIVLSNGYFTLMIDHNLTIKYIEDLNYNYAALKHFRCKTIEEYLGKFEKLIKYGYIDVIFDYNFFCEYNINTLEKEQLFNKLISKIPNYNYIVKNALKSHRRKVTRKKLEKATICIIACVNKEIENIKEWLDWHIQCGIDHFYLYDKNNCISKIQNYIDKGVVTIFNYNDKFINQQQCYTDIYNKFGDEYKWTLIINIDDFVCLPKYQNKIKKYLITIPDDKKCIGINCYYGDNELVKYEDKSDIIKILIKAKQYFNNNLNVTNQYNTILKNCKDINENIYNVLFNTINNINDFEYYKKNYKIFHIYKKINEYS